MSTTITIGNQVITIPTSGTDANWSEGIVDAFEAIATELATIQPGDNVAQTVQDLVNNSATTVNLTGATFDSATVRSFTLNYAVYRQTSGAGAAGILEQGTLNGVYDTLAAEWSLSRTYSGDSQSDGVSYHSFSMSTDTVTFTKVVMPGAAFVSGTISWSATTQLVAEA